MECWFCHKPLTLPEGKVSFRACCPSCSAWIHSCKGCKHHQQGLPNNCKMPDTDPISDADAANFCDEYTLQEVASGEQARRGDAEEKLFGEISAERPPSSFDDFFH